MIFSSLAQHFLAPVSRAPRFVAGRQHSAPDLHAVPRLKLDAANTPPVHSASKNRTRGAWLESQFDKIQSRDHLVSYFFGGMTEGLAKFFQRDDKEKYLENPVAGVIFKPIHRAAQFIAEQRLGANASPEKVSHELAEVLGGNGIVLGNTLKFGAALFTAFSYYKLGKASHETALIEKARKALSTGKIVYLAEKLTLIGAGALCASQNYGLASLALLTSWMTTLGLAGISAKIFIPLLRDISKDPIKLKNNRDTLKSTSLSLVKGGWAASALGVSAFLLANQSQPQNCIKVLNALGIDQVPSVATMHELYKTLFLRSWELPLWVNLVSAAFMITPALTALYFDTLNFLKAQPVHMIPTAPLSGTDSTEIPDNKTLTKQRRRYHAASMFADICNATSGYYLSFFLWYSLGSVFFGVGALATYAQYRMKKKTANL